MVQGGEELCEQAKLRRLVGTKLLDVFVSGVGSGSYVLTFENGTQVIISSSGSPLTTTDMTYIEACEQVNNKERKTHAL
jgi:hypothetical protein